MSPLPDEVDLAALGHPHLTTSRQLRQLGRTARQIKRDVERGVLHPVIEGVFSRCDNVSDFLVRATAMCLKYPIGHVSGPAANHYWGMRKGAPSHYEFTVPPGCRPAGLEFAQLRFSAAIAEQDVFDQLGGLRVASPARAVFDAAGRLDEFGLRSMIQSGINNKVLTTQALAEVGERLCRRVDAAPGCSVK